jgi:hypothetical protein
LSPRRHAHQRLDQLCHLFGGEAEILVASLGRGFDEAVTLQPFQVGGRGGGLDPGAQRQFLGRERAAFHEQREHLDAAGVAHRGRDARKVGFGACIHRSMIAKLLMLDKRGTARDTCLSRRPHDHHLFHSLRDRPLSA